MTAYRKVGKLKIVAKLVKLMPAGKGGRGKKGATQGVGFSRKAAATYRKVHKHAGMIDDYFEQAMAGDEQ